MNRNTKQIESDDVNYNNVRFLRYPGGKSRLLKYIIPHLPTREQIRGRYVEPFVGGGAVFFYIDPKKTLLADTNKELIDLYRGLKNHSDKIWKFFKNFPSTKEGYYNIRSNNDRSNTLAFRAARTLYLNRTCFKGMWRYNKFGKFNVGYGGQERRWVITQENLSIVSSKLEKASIKVSDFEVTIDKCNKDDFIFLDPPYSSGKKELTDNHYSICKFNFDDHVRLSKILKQASNRGVKWTITTSSHIDIKNLFKDHHIFKMPIGIGKNLGTLTDESGEIIIQNF